MSRVKPLTADPTWKDPSLNKPHFSRFVFQNDFFWTVNRVMSLPYLGSLGESIGVPCVSSRASLNLPPIYLSSLSLSTPQPIQSGPPNTKLSKASEPTHMLSPKIEGRGEGTYQRLVPSPLHGMDQVPVTVGLAVRVQPVLQELLLSAVL